jgi:transposase-like protein
MADEQEKRSFWRRLFSVDTGSAREEKVVGYFLHRIAEGATLREVSEEEYVRRNASPAELEEILQNPKLLESAHEHMREDFESGELDPRRRPE